MGRRPTAAMLAAVLVANAAMPTAAGADSYFFRYKGQAAAGAVPPGETPAAEPLVLAASAAGAVEFVAGEPWDLTFTASGGKAPYAFAVAPARSGPTAGLVHDVGETSVRLGGTAEAGSYEAKVTVTDAAGKTAAAAVPVSVTAPTPVAANLERPKEATPSTGTMRQSYEEQPSWNVLYDQSDRTWATANASTPVIVKFARPVTFGEVFVWAENVEYGADIKVLQDGQWVNAGVHAGSYQSTVRLDRTYTATEISYQRRYQSAKLYEMRVGAGPAAPSPRKKAAAPAIVAPSSDTIEVSRFEAPSPYRPGAVSLALTPPEQAGVRMSVTADAIRILSRPAYDVDVGVVLSTPDGLMNRVVVQVQGLGDGKSIMVPPTSVTGAKGELARASDLQPDWHVLHDNVDATYANVDHATTLVQSFDRLTTFSEVLVRTPDGSKSADILVKQGDQWIVAGEYRGMNSQTVALNRVYTARDVAFRPHYGPNTLQEMRIGGKAGAPLPTALANPPVIAANASAVLASAFQSVSNYHPGRISLADTPTEQAGVRLAVSDGEVRVVSRPAHNVDIGIVARTDDGLRSVIRHQVQASGAGTSVMAPPVSITDSVGGLVTVDDTQPDWHLLHDGASGTYASVGMTPVVQRFAEAVTFDRVYLWLRDESRGMEIVVKQGGKWVVAGTVAPTYGDVQRTVALTRAFTATEVGVRLPWGNYTTPVYEMRVDGRAVAPRASLAGTDFPAGGVKASAFTAASPYHAGRVWLDETPTAQGGVVLDVSADEVRIVSQPAHSVDVAIVARTADGLRAGVLLRVPGASNGTSVYENPVEVVSGNNDVRTAYVGQPTWNVLNDGASNSTAWASNTGPASIRFARPIAVNKVYFSVGSNNYGAEILVRQDGKWVVAGRTRSTSGNVIFQRAFVTDGIAYRTPSNYDATTVMELRAGASAAFDPRN